MKYDCNPKHKEPWQRGRRGSLCPKEIDPETAQRLLDESELAGQARYAVHEGIAYCAREHTNGIWHGYPVGWVEVPAALRITWRQQGRITRRDLRNHWY